MKKCLLVLLFTVHVIALRAADCEILPFIANYTQNIGNQDVYFVQGIKLETIYHGIKVLIIDNYKENIIHDTVMVWCSDGNSGRIEYSTSFSDNDTIILLITLTDLEGNDPGDNNDIPDTLEKSDDFMPIPCNYSILKYLNDSVIGRIESIANDTMISFDSFFGYLNSFLLVDEKDRNLFKIYPNPAYDYILINRSTCNTSECILVILNTNGVIIDRLFIQPFEKTIKYRIDSLNKGMYLINIYQRNNLIHNSKIFKV